MSVFLSYRREDTDGVANRLYQDLARRYGANEVLFDKEIPAGELWENILEDGARHCRALIALVGRSWLHSHDTANGIRRLDDPDDWVRREIGTAINYGRPLIVVLVEDTPALTAGSRLPEPLNRLHSQQALRLRSSPRDWNTDVEALIQRIDAISSASSTARISTYLRSVIEYCEWVGSDLVPRGPSFDTDRWKMDVRYVHRHVNLKPNAATVGQEEVWINEDLATLLRQHPRIALLGEPGAGKTTALRNVAMRHAKAIQGGDPDALFPVFLSAPSIAASLQRAGVSDPAAENFFVYWDEENRRQHWGLPRDSLIEVFGRFKVAVLIDALDAVAPEWVNRILDMIRGVVIVHNSAHWCIGTRPFAWHPELLPTFRPATIGELTDAQIRDYLDRCSRLDIETHIDQRPADFKLTLEQEIRCNATLRDLAKRPLFLTAICAVYTANGSLPNDLPQLFRMISERLIESRDPHAGKYVGITRARAYECAAYVMCCFAGRGNASIDELIAAICGQPNQTNPATAEPLDQFLRSEFSDSRLLLKHGGTYSFPHRVFQDYLTARYLVDTDRWREAVSEHLTDPEWEEVLAFLAAILVSESRGVRTGIVSDGFAADELVMILLTSAATSTLLEMSSTVERAHRAFRYVRPGRFNLESVTAYRDMEEALLAIFTMQGAACLAVKERLRVAQAIGRRGDRRLRGPAPPVVPIELGAIVIGAQSGRPEGQHYDKDASSRETVCTVCSGPFEIGQYPVTVQEYRRFVEDGGYDRIQTSSYWTKEGIDCLLRDGRSAPKNWEKQLETPNCPVTEVTFFEAEAYCRWLTRVDGEGIYRLPTEDEWEFAVRRGDDAYNAYSWGSEARAAGTIFGLNQLVPVGFFAEDRSRSGLCDVTSNVSEWTRGNPITKRCQHPTLASQQPSDPSNGLRTIKGGTYRNALQSNRTSVRIGKQEAIGFPYVGFRVLRRPKAVEIKGTQATFECQSTLADYFAYFNRRHEDLTRSEELNTIAHGLGDRIALFLEILLPETAARVSLLPCRLGDNEEKFRFNLHYQDSRIRLECERQYPSKAQSEARADDANRIQSAVACILAFPHHDNSPLWRRLNDNDLDAIVFEVLNALWPERGQALIAEGLKRNDVALAALPAHETLLQWPMSQLVAYQVSAGVLLLNTLERQLTQQFPQVSSFAVFDVEAFERALETHPHILFVCDDNGELVWDLALIEVLLCRYQSLRVTAVISTVAVGNNATIEALNHCLAQERFKQLRVEARFRVHHEANSRPALDPDCASREFLDLWVATDYIYLKGVAAFETIQQLPKPGFYAFIVYSSDSERCTGYKRGTGVFLSVTSGVQCFHYLDPIVTLKTKLEQASNLPFGTTSRVNGLL